MHDQLFKKQKDKDKTGRKEKKKKLRQHAEDWRHQSLSAEPTGQPRTILKALRGRQLRLLPPLRARFVVNWR